LTIYNFGVVVAEVKRTASLEDLTMGGHFERAPTGARADRRRSAAVKDYDVIVIGHATLVLNKSNFLTR
jgi:hypothetical protein